jgi:hypothetical protein
MLLSSRKAFRLAGGSTAVARTVHVALALAATLAAADGARAANWDFRPRVEFGATYSDNYRLSERSADQIAVGGPLVDAELGVYSISPRSDWSIVPRVRSDYFPNHESEQSTDGYLTLKGDYHTQKSVLSGVAQYSNQSVIFSELLPATAPGAQLGQPTTGSESGRVNFQNRQQLVRVAPDWTYTWTQRRNLELSAEYVKVMYDQNLFQQVGFQNYDGVAGLRFDISQRSALTIRGSAARFEPDNGGSPTNTYAVEGQYDLNRTQVSRAYFRAGVGRTDVTLNGTSVTSTGFSGGAGVSWTWQITQLTFDAIQSYEPSAYGAVLLRDELRFRLNRNLKPRLLGYVAARGIHVRGAQTAVTVQNRDYATGEAGFEWQITRNYRLVGAYDYTWQRFQGEPTANANAVALSVVWQPVSRFEPLTPYDVGIHGH